MNQIIHNLVSMGIPVTLKYDREQGVVFYDLNAGTKSGMRAYEVPGKAQLRVLGRYNEDEMAYSVDDMCSIFASRYRARNFGADEWIKLACDFGHLSKTVQEVISYS